MGLNKDIDWALQQKAPPSCKHILLVLANRTDKNHSCYPSLTKICDDTGLDRSTVSRCMAQLLDLGLITREKRGILTNIYVLQIGAPCNYKEAHHAPSSTTPHW